MAEPTRIGIAREGFRLVIEIRSWRFGFVVLRDGRLIDWGSREFPMGGAAKARDKVLTLVDAYPPAVVLTRRTRGVSHSSSIGAALILRSIRTALTRRNTELVVLDRETIKLHFTTLGCRGKYEIAQRLSQSFPELEWRIPKRRRAWDREDHIVPVFDALATAVAFEANQSVSEAAH